jgi:hypothetical protein
METSVIQRHSYEACTVQCAISGFCRAVSANCAHLGYYSASSGNLYLLFNKPEVCSFQVNTKLWVYCFACWLFTDRNGTAVILLQVHSVNQIIEITEIIRYHGTEHRHEEMGLTKETILELCSKLWQVNWERYIFWGSTLSVWVCLLSLGLCRFREWHKRGSPMLPKGVQNNCGWSVNTIFCVHLVMTKRHLIVVGWNPVM